MRLHWTDKPYKWHINDGEEVFAVHGWYGGNALQRRGQEKAVLLHTGDIFMRISVPKHVAHPQGEARILVIEKEDSI